MFVEIAIICLSALVLYLFLEPKQFPKNLPPGPTRLPYIGNVIQLARAGRLGKTSPYHRFQELNKQYGPVAFIKIGVLKQALLTDIDTIKELMASELWVDRFYDDYMAQRSFGKTLGVLMVSGIVWKEMRRFSVRTLRDFGFGKLKSMDTTIQEELDELAQALSERVNSDRGAIVSMKQYFTISVLNILWVMIAGSRFSHENQKLHHLLDLLDKSTRANAIGSFEMTLYTAFPFFRFLPKLLNIGQERLRLFAELQQFFRDILQERRQEGIYKEEQRDFIDVFLREIDAHAGENLETNLYTDEQFVIVSMDLFMAGSETTSNTMEFALLYMILHPEVQRRVQAEIDNVIGSSRLPSILDKPKMPYTEATLIEVQRLANVVPLIVRSPTQETAIGEYTIPKGTLGVVNIHAVHMNEKVFKDPHVFKPERFLDSQNNVVNSQSIIPFGTGRRICLGETLAKTSLFVFFTTYLQRYTFEKSPNHPAPTMEPALGFTLAPQPYHALIKPRVPTSSS